MEPATFGRGGAGDVASGCSFGVEVGGGRLLCSVARASVELDLAVEEGRG
jgi:hypothetical protein